MCLVKKILPSNKKTKFYLDKLPKLYLVAKFAMYDYLEFPFSGKYKRVKIGSKNLGIPIYEEIPLVYLFTDHNGEKEEFILTPITSTTTGVVYGWYGDKKTAQLTADLLNKQSKIIGG